MEEKLKKLFETIENLCSIRAECAGVEPSLEIESFYEQYENSGESPALVASFLDNYQKWLMDAEIAKYFNKGSSLSAEKYGSAAQSLVIAQDTFHEIFNELQQKVKRAGR